jgi:hypothetical protein
MQPAWRGARPSPKGDEPPFIGGRQVTVMRSIGIAIPALRMAARTRSRFSRTVESGKPTVLTVGAAPPLWLSA